MNRVISKESVRMANDNLINRDHCDVSVDAKNVSVRRRTTSGVYMMTFSRDEIRTAANEAFSKVVK